MRIFCTSDLHVDYLSNMNWVLNLSMVDYQDDVLIVAGDICDKKALIVRTFRELAKRFKAVCFVPGNHDLWVLRDKESSSIDKFEWLYKVAAEEGIKMNVHVTKKWEIIPLYSWFDYSFGKPDAKLLKEWVDFRACKWPEGMSHLSFAAWMFQKNTILPPVPDRKRITFSHFVPFMEFLPKIPIANYLMPVLGSTTLGNQILALQPEYHVFGHFHMNRSAIKDGVRYIDNALGYPKETFLKRRLVCINGEI